MKPARRCDQCQAELPGDAPEGLCPQCLLQLGGIELGVSLELQSEGCCKQNADNESPATKPIDQAPENQRNGILVVPGAGGTRFGNYEILERIGRGGMGAVYKARQLNLDRVVALKLLPLGAWSGPNLVERFRSEAKAAAALQHPNIVAVHDVGEQDGQPFFTMDFVEGRTLAELVRDQPLPAKRAATYLQTIAAAVHYAHQQGVLHRDLKPSNILIDATDQPRITDFGLAKRLRGDSDLTLTGQVLGSPNFMSPEQAEGRSELVGPPSDVYSLGAVLYDLLTRQPPFQADTVTTLLKQVVEAEPVPPCSLNPNIPKDLETTCLKCLEKDPARRYPTAQALADDLGRFLRGEPVRARPVGAAAKAWKWCRRRPGLAGVSVALILTIVAGLSGVLWQLQQNRSEKLAAQQNAYAADMNLAQVAVEKGDLGAAMALLKAHQPAPGERDLRGWEWRYLWQCCRSDELFELTRSAVGIDRITFSPDGRWLAARDKNANLTFWDTGSRRPVFSLKMWGYLNPFAFSKTGDLLAYATAGTQAVSVVELKSRQEVVRLPQTNNIAQVAFSADATRLFTFSETGRLIEWNLALKQALRTFEFIPRGFEDGHNTVAFSANGKLMAWCHERGVGLCELNSGLRSEVSFTGVENTPTALSFSADGKLLAAGMGGSESEVFVWAVEDLWGSAGPMPAPRGRFGKHRDWICDIAFSPDGQALVSASADSMLRVWQLDHPEVCRRYQGHQHQVWSVAWSPDGRQLASTGRDGSVRIWDPSRPPSIHGPEVLPVAPLWWQFCLSADAKRAIVLEPRNSEVTAATVGAAVLWDTENMRRLETLEFAGTNIARFGWSPDGRLLATGDNLGNVTVWDLAGRREAANFRIEGVRIGFLEFSWNGRFLTYGVVRHGPAYGASGGFWETDRWREVPLPSEALKNLTWGAISPDGRLVAILQNNGTLDLWDVRSGRGRVPLAQPFAVPGEWGYVAFSPDGRTLASSTQWGAVALWDVAGKRPPNIMPRTTQELWDLSFSADGTRLIVSGKRASDVVRVLDLGSRRFVASLAGETDVYWFSRMSADNSAVYAVGTKNVLLWRAPSWAEIEAAEKGKGTP